MTYDISDYCGSSYTRRTITETDPDQSVVFVPGGQVWDTPRELANIFPLLPGRCSARVNEDGGFKAVHPRDERLLRQCCSSPLFQKHNTEHRAFNHD